MLRNAHNALACHFKQAELILRISIDIKSTIQALECTIWPPTGAWTDFMTSPATKYDEKGHSYCVERAKRVSSPH